MTSTILAAAAQADQPEFIRIGLGLWGIMVPSPIERRSLLTLLCEFAQIIAA